VLADPPLGCDAFNNAEAIVGQVLLVQRGTCFFAEKAERFPLHSCRLPHFYFLVVSSLLLPLLSASPNTSTLFIMSSTLRRAWEAGAVLMIVANNEVGFSVVMGADEPHLNLTTFPSVMVRQRNVVLISFVICSFQWL
jgi:hypothetical protein